MAVQGVPARRRVRRCASSLVAVLCLMSVAPATVPAAALYRTSPIGVHSMLYLTHPFAFKVAMFSQAAALGASTIRVDVELSGVFPSPTGPPDWSGLDQYMWLAHRYHLRVLADLLATPWYLADCPAGVPADRSYTCPPANPRAWARQAGMIAAHARGVIDYFEIINEPDGKWAFTGSPQQYAHILADAYRSIHAANPAAEVALGGVMDPGPAGQAWTAAMLSTPGADALHRFDIANIHVRTSAAVAAATVIRWRRYLGGKGFRGPLWVTETGYPADPAWQTQPGYRRGPLSQARWMTAAIPAMICAGAGMVFVTERDNLTGRYATEGILQSKDPLTAVLPYTRRPSFYAVRAMAERSWLSPARVAGLASSRGCSRRPPAR